MVIEINKDIDRYQESVAMGLTAKQLVFSIASVIVGGGIVLLLYSFLDLAVKFKAAGQFFVGFNAHNGKVAFSILRDENWFRIIMTKCRNFIVIIP